ncbi:MAG: preprotein translocase subunit YajC [Tannerella sp.]|jgi:preprotein translocase subunit YajC|nr:preprotein translocase subunit YajC [Tannerella sp.]
MNTLSTVLQAPESVPGGMGGSSMSIVMIIAMIAIFYFFMIRPQQKRQKDIQKAREAMKIGDKVVTAGGIHGRIKEIAERSMLVEVADGVRIRVDKASIFASPEDIQPKS